MKEYNFWTSYFTNNVTTTTTSTSNDVMMKKKPRYLFYQNAKELQGRREVDGYDWRSNIFRVGNEFLRFYYRSLGFNELDEYVLSIGRLPHTYNPSYDGWHIFGTIRKMEVIVLINMLCNQ